MTRRHDLPFTIAWSLLTATGVAVMIFGLVTVAWPGPKDASYVRAIGVASVGMGLFGTMITLIPYRNRERWAWFTLWAYPVFWIAHLVGRLPPGRDHVHQVLFIILSLAGLLIPVGSFFPGRPRPS